MSRQRRGPSYSDGVLPGDLDPVVAAGSVAAVLVALVVLRGWRRRRQAVRRVAAVVGRLEPAGAVDLSGRGRLESCLAALERAASAGALRFSDAQVAAERLAEALAALDQGVVVCDENAQVLASNTRAEDLSGHGSGDAPVGDLVKQLLAAAVEGEAGAEVVQLPGPPPGTIALRAVPLSNDSRLIGAAAVIEDMSSTRHLESARRDFTASVVRELQGPVEGMAMLAGAVAEEPEPAVMARLAQRLQAEASRLAAVMSDLTQLSRVEAEEALLREPVPLHLLLAEAVGLVAPLAEKRGAHIEVSEPGRRMAVLGDRRQLVAALAELVENAVVHSADGTRVELLARTSGAWAEVTVSDEGPGIPAGELDRIFERFYRLRGAGQPPSGRRPGPGLGLALVRHVAASHGGEVRVQSEAGVGSTFTLRLPLLSD